MPNYNRTANQHVFKATKGLVSFGYQELDLITKLMWQNEPLFNEQFSAEQLLVLYRKAASLPNRDKLGDRAFPDFWDKRQVKDALNGLTPKWDEEGNPVY